jgi:1-acyl-sn-glycerol-3-phosphate acyltransferase
MIYPEGHRSTRPRPLALKRGMLHYAYSRKLPLQVGAGGLRSAAPRGAWKAPRLGMPLLSPLACLKQSPTRTPTPTPTPLPPRS